jgi:uncharacterized repeat protein (TIGR02543 family)
MLTAKHYGLPWIASIAILASSISAVGISTVVTAPSVAAAPAPATLLWKENFENFGASSPNGLGTTVPMAVNWTQASPAYSSKYVGANANGAMTFTGDSVWLDPNNCNGIIISEQAQSADFLGCPVSGTPSPINSLRTLAGLIGNSNGTGKTVNHAVAAFTGGAGAPGVMAQTEKAIPLTSMGSRFLSARAWISEANCGALPNSGSRSRLQFQWSPDGSNWNTMGDPRVWCTGSSVTTNIYGSGLLSADVNQVYLQFKNLNGETNGNDLAWDDISLFDATPTLTKAFSPNSLDLAANPGAVSKLTFTITNTDEYGEKIGWSFEDQLPAGLVIADSNPPTFTRDFGACSATVTNSGGAPLSKGDATIKVSSGSLSYSPISSPFAPGVCTISVNVTGVANGTFTNYVAPSGSNANVTSIVGLIPSSSAQLTISGTSSIVYNANGGAGTMSPTSGTVNSTQTIATNGFTNSTEFLGWSTSPTGPVAYQSGDTITMPTGGVTLYAVWGPETITYDGNGATGTVVDTTGAPGSSVTLATDSDLTPPDPTYTFLGWSTDPNATTATYVGGATITMPDGGLNLYAVWDPPIQASIVYEANGGTGAMNPTTAPIGSAATLSGNGFANTSEFLGWSTSASGPVEYQSGDSITMPANGLTLYAIWGSSPPPAPPAQMITLTYDANGGTCNAPAQTEPLETWVSTYGPESCTRSGYTFKGWNTSPDGSGLGFAPGAATVLTSDNTLYAQWLPIRLDAVDDVIGTLIDTPVSGSVTANDSFPQGSTFTTTSNPSSGSVVFNADGTYIYTPGSGFVGTDVFTYTVCAPGGSPCATANVSITVAGTIAPPSLTTTGVPVSGSVGDAQVDPTGSVFTVVKPPTNGTVEMAANGTYTYSPNLGFVGEDSFTYQICVSAGVACPTGTVNITVVDGPVINARPQLKPISPTSTEPISFGPRTLSKGGTIAITKAGANAWGNRIVVPGIGTWVVNGQRVTFTPAANFYGRSSIRYRVIEASGAITYSTFTAVRIAMPGLIDGGR